MKFSPTYLRRFAAPLLSIVVVALTASELQATAYTFREFNHPGANENSTSFSAINDAGLIAGHYGSGTPGNEIVTAFIFDGLSYSTFSVPGAWGTFARGINSAGVVVGEFGLPGLPAGGGGAFIYDGTSFTTFNHPGETDNSTTFSAINDAGLIAGHYGSGTPGNEIVTSFIFDGLSYTTFSVPGAWGTFARGINSAGVVVGEFGLRGLPAGGGGAFIYDGTSFTTFNHPGETDNSTIFSAINDAGLIAGHYGSGTPGNEIATSFIFDGLSYTNFSVPDAWGTFARGINSDGIVVGEFGVTDGGGGAFIAEPVPEPSTIALVCLGILSILLLKKSKYRLTVR